MVVREIAEFLTDLPDGAIEDEEGEDFLVWPGRPALEAIGEILGDLDCRLGEISDVGEAGWELPFDYKGYALRVRVTEIERHVAYFSGPSIWSKLIGGRRSGYLELLERFSEAFAADPRFHEVCWHTRNEFSPTITRAPESAG